FTRRMWEERPEAAGAEHTAATPTREPAPSAAETVVQAQVADTSSPSVRFRVALRHPIVWFQVWIYFFYTGLEASVGQWSFTLLTESRGFAEAPAGAWVTAYWASIGVGRVLLGTIAGKVG